MTGRVFLNYRRGDEPGFAGRLFDRLEQAFTAERLFMDVDHIGPGEDFVRVLEDEVGKCNVLLAIIGKGWISASDELGQRRLDSPNDFVRIEIESALKQGKRIVPVLINDAQMPRADDLPETLKPLARRNAVRLTHERFKSDAQGLVQILEKALSEVEAARALKDEAERRAAEDALRRKQEEESARAAEAERQAQIRAREQASLGLSAAEISKAEELANWDFIKGANDATELRNHLARFPGGVTERYARAALEEVIWSEVRNSLDSQAVKGFLAEFPLGKHAAQASFRLATIEKQSDGAMSAFRARKKKKEALFFLCLHSIFAGMALFLAIRVGSWHHYVFLFVWSTVFVASFLHWRQLSSNKGEIRSCGICHGVGYNSNPNLKCPHCQGSGLVKM